MTQENFLKKLLNKSPVFRVFALGTVGGWVLAQVLFGFFLMLRYCLAAFPRTLPTGLGVLLTGVLLLQTFSLAAALDFVEKYGWNRKYRKSVQIAWACLLVSCVAGGFICLRGAPWGVFLFAALLLAGGGYIFVRFAKKGTPEPIEEPEHVEEPEPIEEPEHVEEPEPTEEFEFEEEEPEELLPPQTVQSFTRATNEAGEDTFSGLVRATFAPGMKSVTVYVAFCPPFEHVPEVECEVVDGDASIVTPIFVAPHGVRIGVKKAGAVSFEDCAILSLTAVEKKSVERTNDE